MMTDPQRIIEAAELVRAQGYAIVTKVEQEYWNRWLREAWDRERQLQDENQRLLWGYGTLLDKATELVAPSRPAWLRRARSWWNNYEYKEPIVSHLADGFSNGKKKLRPPAGGVS